MQLSAATEQKKAEVYLKIREEEFTYSNQLYKESEIEYGQDLDLNIEQEGLPDIDFKYPDVDESLEAGFSKFRYEKRMPRAAAGFISPVTLSFKIKNLTNAPYKAIAFREGDMEVNIEGNQLTMSFDGQGEIIYPKGKEETFPIKGRININLKKTRK